MLETTLTGKARIGSTPPMRRAARASRIVRAARWTAASAAMLLGVARLFLVGACAVHEEAASAPRGCLYRDPSPHRVVVHGCETSLDCPEGTACVSNDWTRDGDRWAECTDPDGGESSCRAPGFAYVKTSALPQGFGVREMKLTRSAESGVSVYTWTAPEEVVTVVCALFGSPPLFRPSTARKDATGEPIVEMVNFDEAVLAWRAFSGDRSSTTIEDLVAASTDSVPADIDPGAASSLPRSNVFVLGCGLRTPGPRYLSECPRATTVLSFGCWAYAGTEIVAASVAMPVDLSEQASQGWVLGEGECAIPTNGEPTDGRACALPRPEGATENVAFFGGCRDGQCVVRCARDEDCCPSGECPDVCLCPKLGIARSSYGRPFVGQCGAPADGDPIDSEACTFSGAKTGGTSP